MAEPNEINQLLLEAQERVKLLSESLPKEVPPLGIAKFPYKVLCYRESLIWRLEELARSALENFKNKNIVTAISLTRSVVETVAAIWFLYEEINKHIQDDLSPKTTEELDAKIMRLLLGSKDGSSKYEAINVLTFLEKIELKIPGFLEVYKFMSEYAHPNFAGTLLVFSKADKKTLITHFGKDVKNLDPLIERALGSLNGTLGVFEIIYNELSELMQPLVDKYENFFAKKPK